MLPWIKRMRPLCVTTFPLFYFRQKASALLPRVLVLLWFWVSRLSPQKFHVAHLSLMLQCNISGVHYTLQSNISYQFKYCYCIFLIKDSSKSFHTNYYKWSIAPRQAKVTCLHLHICDHSLKLQHNRLSFTTTSMTYPEHSVTVSNCVTLHKSTYIDITQWQLQW